MKSKGQGAVTSGNNNPINVIVGDVRKGTGRRGAEIADELCYISFLKSVACNEFVGGWRESAEGFRPLTLATTRLIALMPEKRV
jgi:hypothetical protein